jgi:4'-phosphopantetheinyl transferase
MLLTQLCSSFELPNTTNGLLHPLELARFERFRVPKRRQDWLLGRWTAKLLVQQYLAATGPGPTRSLDQIVIPAAADGAPYVMLATSGGTAAPPLPLSLSISHSGGWAFCALCDEPWVAAGADIERIEPRESSFVDMFFAPSEAEQVRVAAPADRDTVVTALWSAKEAVLKALRVGLRVDTRGIVCNVGQPPAPSSGVWAAFRAEAVPVPSAPHPEIAGCWKVEHGFVLALVTLVTDPLRRS